jgi:hypothetical protein
VAVQGTVGSTGSTLLTVTGTAGELFSVTDDLTGTLLAVNNASSQSILSVDANNTILLGDPLAPSLYTTITGSATTGTTTLYALPSTSYSGSFIDYTVVSGANSRAGNLMGIWAGGTARYSDTSTSDIGDTTQISFIIGTTGAFQASVTSGTWTVKAIIKSI